MRSDRSSDDDDAERERDVQLDAELRALRKERDEILDGTNRELLQEMEEVERRKALKLRLSEDSRQYQIWYVTRVFESDIKFACDQYWMERAELRETMIKANLERKKRLENLRMITRRTRRPANAPAGVLKKTKREMAANGNDILRIELTPDEVHNDMDSILKGLEDTQRLAPQKKLSDRFGRNGPEHGIRAYRGVFYYFDQAFSRGQQIEVTVKPQLTKIFGPIKAISSKEIQIEASRSRTERVLIAQIRSGKCVVRRRPSKS